MKLFLHFAISLAFVIFPLVFIACGDDSSSTSGTIIAESSSSISSAVIEITSSDTEHDSISSESQNKSSSSSLESISSASVSSSSSSILASSSSLSGTNSSSSALHFEIGDNWLLDTAAQTLGIIFDRCLVGSTSVSWVKNVDTTFYDYEWLGDTLVFFKSFYGSSSSAKTDFLIFLGGTANNIYGTWHSIKNCTYADAAITCTEPDANDKFLSLEDGTILNVSSTSVDLSYQISENARIASDAFTSMQGTFASYIDTSTFIFTEKDAKAGTITYGTNTANLTTSATKNGNATSILWTLTNGSSTCSFGYTKSTRYFQMPESLCNETDMAEYIGKYSDETYIYTYKVTTTANKIDDFYKCAANNIFDIEL